jgi:exosortase F-associated protein
MVVLGSTGIKTKVIRVIAVSFLLFLLFLSFHSRNTNWLVAGINAEHFLFFLRPALADWLFVGHKLVRFAINDILSIAIIHLVFSRWSFTRVSIYVLLIGLFAILPIYLAGHLLGFQNATMAMLHRLTMNPILILILIPAFYFQLIQEKGQQKTD